MRLVFFLKNLFLKNVEAEITVTKILRTYQEYLRPRVDKNVFILLIFILNDKHKIKVQGNKCKLAKILKGMVIHISVCHNQQFLFKSVPK